MGMVGEIEWGSRRDGEYRSRRGTRCGSCSLRIGITSGGWAFVSPGVIRWIGGGISINLGMRGRMGSWRERNCSYAFGLVLDIRKSNADLRRARQNEGWKMPEMCLKCIPQRICFYYRD